MWNPISWAIAIYLCKLGRPNHAWLSTKPPARGGGSCCPSTGGLRLCENPSYHASAVATKPTFWGSGMCQAACNQFVFLQA